jgi:peptidase E
MSNLKPIYLMAGGRGSRGTDPAFKAIFKDIDKKSPTIAYIGAASEDNWLFFKMISGMIKQAGDCKIIRVVLCSKKASIEKAQEEIQSADAIFMSGGDVEAGMQVLEEKGMTKFIQDQYQQGKLFFGASAGSIMLAREWVCWRNPEDDSTAELFPCLELASVICDTHAEEDDWEELKTALLLKGDGAAGYGITSGTCLKVSANGQVEALGGKIAQYQNSSGNIKKQPDLQSR